LNIDLGSPIIDIAVGLSFVFFLLSVIASAVSEFCAGVVNLRGKTLLKGIEGMVGDEKIAKEVFDHPLVRSNGKKDTKVGLAAEGQGSLSLCGRIKLERKPSYVSAENFARALLAISGEQKPETKAEQDESSAAFLWKQLGALGVKGKERDLPKIEKWFDDSMERVSGWYKRWSQWLTIAIAIAVAIGLNANTLRIAERLDKEPATRAAVVASAEKTLEKEGETAEEKAEEKGGSPNPVAQIKDAGETFSKATGEVTALKLPFLWGDGNDPGTMSWVDNALGWFLTIVAISLGAPFWFDTLNKLANLRLAGKKPEEAPKPAH
jgi:hypothetical protein